MTGERALYFVGFAVCVVTYQVWGYLPKGCFYYGMAISWLVIALHDWLRTCDHQGFDKYSLLVLVAAIGNLLDELFFEPGIPGINDAISGCIVIIGLIHPSKRLKWPKNTKTN